MDKYKSIALDESGKASFNHPSKNFVLAGVIIPEKYSQKLENQIKKLRRNSLRMKT